jgi:hypothetical protein|tara:strand:- start:19 stop:795 length:777 start_codon:yes stop_codon:yes gene_type:complete
MATVLGSKGVIEIMEDFDGPEWIIAETAASGNIGKFRVVGQGVADTDAGIVILEADGLNGVAQMTSPNASDNDAIALTTGTMFDVGLMGTIVAEARVRMADLATKEVFFGFSDLNTDTHSMEGVLIHGDTATITLTASDLVGFLFSSELTDKDWHTVYNGGSTTGVTASGSLDVGDNPVAGEWQILRVELDADGRARWYIDGVQVGGTTAAAQNGVAGAVSTTTDLACQLVLEIKGTGANETIDVDYIYVRANRDWTV